jgi:hypothetical protein
VVLSAGLAELRAEWAEAEYAVLDAVLARKEANELSVA